MIKMNYFKDFFIFFKLMIKPKSIHLLLYYWVK